MKPKLELTAGADPELVIVNGDLKPQSAIRVLKNSKDTPIKIGDIGLYADNALAEVSMGCALLESRGQFTDMVTNAMLSANRHLNTIGYSLNATSAVEFTKKELNDEKAWEVGCKPSWSAYTEETNPKLQFESGLRTGSFHVHIGRRDWKNPSDDRLMSRESKFNAIRLLDMYLGVSSIVFDKDPTSPLRRSLYGKAGEFRSTDYGVEYRVLGNYALRSRRAVLMVELIISHAMDHLANGMEKTALAQINGKEVQRIINQNDVKAAASAVCLLDFPKTILALIFEQYNYNKSSVMTYLHETIH